jgi:Bardet-Biedl syndrome 2 protein
MQPPFHVPINFVHEIKGEISIKLLCQIRTKEGNINRVYDKKLEIPEFIMFKTVKNMDMDGVSNLKFTLNCKILDVVKWMKNNFLIKKKEDLTETFSSIRGNFIYLPDGSKISITAQISDDSLISVTIFTENLEIAGRCFQHLISVTDPSDINVVLRNFPTEKQKLIDILSNIEDFNVNRMKLSTEIATLSDQLVRFFILAEDSKEINDIQNLRKGYYAINNLNHDIFLEYSKRSSNHEQLVNALKDVNKIIHKAANLRYGKEKTAIISEAREAIKNNTISVLTNLFFY